MNFEKIRAGVYRAPIKPDRYVWLVRYYGRWVWSIGTHNDWTKFFSSKMFASKKEVIEDAIANYEDFLS